MKKKPLYPGDEGYDDAFKLTPDAEERLKKEQEDFYRKYQEHQKRKKKRSWFPFWAIFIFGMVIFTPLSIQGKVNFWGAVIISAICSLGYQLISYTKGSGPTDRGDGFGDNFDGGV